MTITPERLSELRRLHEAATPPPWKWSGRKQYADGYVSIPECSDLAGTLIQLGDSYEGYQEDCDLITECRNALPDLLDEIDRLREEVECYDGMKEGVAIRIADLEQQIAHAKDRSLT